MRWYLLFAIVLCFFGKIIFLNGEGLESKQNIDIPQFVFYKSKPSGCDPSVLKFTNNKKLELNRVQSHTKNPITQRQYLPFVTLQTLHSFEQLTPFNLQCINNKTCASRINAFKKSLLFPKHTFW